MDQADTIRGNTQPNNSCSLSVSSRAMSTLRRVLRFKLFAREDGTNLVETTIAFSVLALFLFGAFEFSLLFFTYQNVADAARQAARWAAVRGGQSCTNVPNLDHCGASTTDITNF